MRWRSTLALGLLVSCSPPAPAGPLPAARDRAVVLISIDGFRSDYLDRPEAATLRRLARAGVRAEWMAPSFPTKTFPNHYTIVTGLYPEHHGIVANNMWDPALQQTFTMRNGADPRWWLGEPVWVTAVKQGRRAAAFFWPGSDVVIDGTRPTYWKPYDGSVPNVARVDSVLAWLSLPDSLRPALVTLYFSDVDHAGHDKGPAPGKELNAAIARVDQAVGRLLDGLERRGLDRTVDVIVVSDHGMTATSRDRVIVLDDYIDTAGVRLVDTGPFVQIWPAPGTEDEVYRRLQHAHPHMQVWRKPEVPARLHYRESPRIAPILALADDGWLILTRRELARANDDHWPGGNHGYDDALPSMRAVFIADGPSFRDGAVVPPFRNIHVYELLCHILGLRPAPNDGSLDSVRAVLRSER